MSCERCACNNTGRRHDFEHYYDIELKLHVSNKFGTIRNVFLFGSGTRFALGIRPDEHSYELLTSGPQKGSVQVLSTVSHADEVLIQAKGMPYVYILDYLYHESVIVNNVVVGFHFGKQVEDKEFLSKLIRSVYLRIHDINFNNFSQIDVDTKPVFICDYYRYDDPNSIYFITNNFYFLIKRNTVVELGLPVIDKDYDVSVNFGARSLIVC